MSSPGTTRPPRSVAEWVSFGVAASILACLMGSIAWLGLQPTEVAVLKVEATGATREAAGIRYVSAEVSNEGRESVEAVQVIAEATVDGEKVDAEQSIQFLSGGASEKVVFLFDDRVPPEAITLRIASYKLP